MDGEQELHKLYCEALDRFVQLRRLTPSEARHLLRDAAVTDRRSYRQLVISAVVVSWHEELAHRGFGNDERAATDDAVEGQLYELCIRVNPGLDIRAVAIQVGGGEGLTVVGGPQRVEPTLDAERYLGMDEALRERVVGQDEAVGLVSAVIRKAKAGLQAPNRPMGVFAFVGQTGVGKTELARCLARFLFGTEDRLVRVDCSEFAMGHEYAKLIGAPPGYVGHDEGGYLTEAVKAAPGSVVVFDEVEKAHRKVHNLLLQVFDEGVLTDGKGNRVSFRDTVVILTSNVGAEEVERLTTGIGFGDADRPPVDQDLRSRETRRALERLFPPEFMNRIDEVITFRPLSRDDGLRILDLLLLEVAARLAPLGLAIEFKRAARAFLVDRGTDPRYGARPLKRAIRRFVENPLSELILSGCLVRGSTIVVGHRKGQEQLSFHGQGTKAPRRFTCARPRARSGRR